MPLQLIRVLRTMHIGRDASLCFDDINNIVEPRLAGKLLCAYDGYQSAAPRLYITLRILLRQQREGQRAMPMHLEPACASADAMMKVGRAPSNSSSIS